MRITLETKEASAVIDTKGAELKSFKANGGKEYIWQGDPTYWGKSSPILFPLVCNLRDNKAVINNKVYEISKHGFARDMEFKLVSQTENTASFLLQDTEETLKHFPFKFDLKLHYLLEGDVLELRYEVVNVNDEVMYYFIGAHPAFNCPMEEDEAFSDYILRFEKEEVAYTPVYDLEKLVFQADQRICRLDGTNKMALEYDLFDEDAILFDALNSRSVALISSKTHKGVKVTFTGFEMLGIWTPMKKEAPFLCIEPWCGTATFNDEGDEFINKRGVQKLEVGEQKIYSLSINIEK